MDFVKSLNDNLDSFDTGNPPPKYPSSYNSSGMISSLIGAGSSLLNGVMGLFTNNANKKENRRQREFAHNEAELQFQRQQQLINQQNEYNSFSNQRKLMEEAGYNPNQFVGNNAGTAISQGGSAQGAATPGVMPMQSPQFNFARDIADLKAVYSQTALNNAQASKLIAETKEIAPNAENIRELNSAMAALHDFNRDFIQRNIKLFDATFENKVKESGLLNDLHGANLDNLKATLESIKQNMHIQNAEFIRNLNEVWPLEIQHLQNQLDIDKATATQLYANAAYLQSLEDATDIQNYINRNTKDWQVNSIRNKAVEQYHNTIAARKGLPWLISQPFSGGGALQFGPFGLSGNVSGTQIYNPYTGEKVN